MDYSTELITVLQNVTNIDVDLDTSTLPNKANIVAITLITVSGECFFNGQGENDFLPISHSVSLDVDFKESTGRLPRIKATTTGSVGIVYSIARRV